MATALIAPLVGGLLGGLGGWLGGGKQQQVNSSFNNTSTQNQNTSQSGTTANYSTPNLSPIQQAMLNQIYAGTSNQLKNGTNLTGYTQQGLENINSGAQNAQASINANNAARGLNFSPAGSAATTSNTLSRVGQGNQFLSQVPLLQTQLQQQALQQAMQGFQIQPTAVTSGGATNQTGVSSGTTNSSGTGVNMQYGNPAGGAVSGAGAGLFGGTALSGQYPNLFKNLFGNSGGGSSPAANYYYNNGQ